MAINSKHIGVLSLLALWTFGCAAQTQASHTQTFAGAPTELTARLVGPIDVELRWKNNASDAAAYLIEFKTKRSAPYLIAASVPPDRNTFTHTRLAPQTLFIYRVRALYGKPSNVVTVTAGRVQAGLPTHTPLPSPKPIMPPSDAELSATSNRSVDRSVRDPSTVDLAAPTRLTATLLTPVNVVLRWQDNAQDEEGYMLETSQRSDSGFVVLGLFPPNTTQFEIPRPLPQRTTSYYRVRAYFSKASNRAELTTGQAPRPEAGSGSLQFQPMNLSFTASCRCNRHTENPR